MGDPVDILGKSFAYLLDGGLHCFPWYLPKIIIAVYTGAHFMPRGYDFDGI